MSGMSDDEHRPRAAADNLRSLADKYAYEAAALRRKRAVPLPGVMDIRDAGARAYEDVAVRLYDAADEIDALVAEHEGE